jgi:hypothetical protein
VRHAHPDRHIALGQTGFQARRDQSRQNTIVVCAQPGVPSLSGSPRFRFCTSCHTLKCGELFTNPLTRDTLA